MSTTEVFNLNKVKSVMNEIESEFSDLARVIEETNTAITTALGSPDKAVFGDAGNKILATWDENCSTLNSFIKIYDNWSSMVVSIATEYGELDKGTAKVEGTDIDSFKTISGANKTTWLSTSEGSKKYVGSTSRYSDSKTNKKVTEQTSLKKGKEVSYRNANGDEITDYYNLAGELIGTKKNSKYYDAKGKEIKAIGEKEQAATDEKVKKAQEVLKKSLAIKLHEKTHRDKEREERRNYKNPAGITGDNLEFILSIMPGAIKAYEEYGVLPSLTLAQAILESRWGKSKLAANNNNLFGIKAGNDWQGDTVNYKTGEQRSDGSRYTINADFRSYDNVADSITDHAKLLTKERYKKVLSAKDYKEACYAVREAGYATSLNYAKNLINVIETYGLNQWDSA